MFKIGDIIKSKYGVMHVIAHIDKDKIYFLERDVIYMVDNDPTQWEIVDKATLLNLEVAD